MGEASRLEGSVGESNVEGSCWATCGSHQTESRPTNQKNLGTYWRPEGRKRCRVAGRGRCCSKSCKRWMDQELQEGLALVGAQDHMCLGKQLASSRVESRDNLFIYTLYTQLHLYTSYIHIQPYKYGSDLEFLHPSFPSLVTVHYAPLS